MITVSGLYRNTITSNLLYIETSENVPKPFPSGYKVFTAVIVEHFGLRRVLNPKMEYKAIFLPNKFKLVAQCNSLAIACKIEEYL